MLQIGTGSHRTYRLLRQSFWMRGFGRQSVSNLADSCDANQSRAKRTQSRIAKRRVALRSTAGLSAVRTKLPMPQLLRGTSEYEIKRSSSGHSKPTRSGVWGAEDKQSFRQRSHHGYLILAMLKLVLAVCHGLLPIDRIRIGRVE